MILMMILKLKRKIKLLMSKKKQWIKRYQRLVGKLIYLSNIRLDIAFEVSIASQYMSEPRRNHMDSTYRF